MFHLYIDGGSCPTGVIVLGGWMSGGWMSGGGCPGGGCLGGGCPRTPFTT